MDGSKTAGYDLRGFVRGGRIGFTSYRSVVCVSVCYSMKSRITTLFRYSAPRYAPTDRPTDGRDLLRLLQTNDPMTT